MQVLGVTLIAATLVIPADRRPDADQLVQHACSGWPPSSGRRRGFVGMNLSYHLDIQSGPTIVLVGAALFAFVFVITGPRRMRSAAGLRRATVS